MRCCSRKILRSFIRKRAKKKCGCFPAKSNKCLRRIYSPIWTTANSVCCWRFSQGCGIGEVCALRWGDISLPDCTLTVSSTMLRLKDYGANARQKTKIVMTDPKSSTSVRVIPLTQYAKKLCALRKKKDPAAFVLTGEKDHYMEPRTLQYRLERYTAECGLVDVHFHVLRHTFATRCVEVGFEIKSLSEILGHTSPKFTLERYVHSSMELKRNNMDKLAAIGY